MCGIVGVWYRDGRSVDESTLLQARDLLAYRGPDDASVWTEGSVGLAHRRLSIIGLGEEGRQPMISHDGKRVITYNGEIYNYRELNSEETADTRVLLDVLAERGAAGLESVQGMYALGMWDAEKEELLLARDPFGKKPLYYIDRKDVFAFASEPKALLALVGELEIDEEALTKYFLHEYVPGPKTGWKDVRQVPMNAAFVIGASPESTPRQLLPAFAKSSAGRRDVGANPASRRGGSPSRSRKAGSDRSLASRLTHLDALLDRAVQRRLVADVPVGVLLSGGLDSTTVAWYMRQIRGRQSEIHSFSVSFNEDSYDEGGYAKAAAGFLGTEHHDVKFGLEDFKATWNEISRQIDIPFADASLLPTYAVSKLAREYVKVVLDGDGSDELLGGYGTFRAARIAERIPDWMQSWLGSLGAVAEQLPTSYDYFSFDFKLKSFLRGMGQPLARRNQVWLGAFSPQELRSLLKPGWCEHIAHVFDSVDELQNEFVGGSVTDNVSHLTIGHYMHSGILQKLDRATMYASLEARTPFLDSDLAQFLRGLPEQDRKDKAILRKLMRGRIPNEIIDRKKQGFALPLGQWLRGPLKEWMEEQLAEEKIKAQGVLRNQEVQRLMFEHVSGRADHRKKLWTLIMWQNWANRYWV